MLEVCIGPNFFHCETTFQMVVYDSDDDTDQHVIRVRDAELDESPEHWLHSVFTQRRPCDDWDTWSRKPPKSRPSHKFQPSADNAPRTTHGFSSKDSEGHIFLCLLFPALSWLLYQTNKHGRHLRKKRKYHWHWKSITSEDLLKFIAILLLCAVFQLPNSK